jgi:hypothetical protein
MFELTPVPLKVIVDPSKNIPLPTGVPETVKILKALEGIATLCILEPGKMPALASREKVRAVPDTDGLLIEKVCPLWTNFIPG